MLLEPGGDPLLIKAGPALQVVRKHSAFIRETMLSALKYSIKSLWLGKILEHEQQHSVSELLIAGKVAPIHEVRANLDL